MNSNPLYLPTKIGSEEIKIRLLPPTFYRIKSKILKEVYLKLRQNNYYTAQNIPKYELAGWPLFVVHHTASLYNGTPSHTFVSIDPWSKATATFERLNDASEDYHPEYDITFPVPDNLEMEEIINIARNRLILQIMRLRKLSISSLKIESKIHSVVYLPVWVCYYARTSKSLDICLLDGYSGEKLGSQFRSAFLNALTSLYTKPAK